MELLALGNEGLTRCDSDRARPNLGKERIVVVRPRQCLRIRAAGIKPAQRGCRIIPGRHEDRLGVTARSVLFA